MTASNISNRIEALPPILIDKIAAGEVIDGPYSVIKELTENSIDAGARKIRIDTRGGGMDEIVIQDDGDGIFYEDMPLAIQRHATSKIRKLDDIEEILSFGFRGEALATISSVSHLEIKSLRRGEDQGGAIECRGGEVIRQAPSAAVPGTVITVSDLFYSTPARKKFVKSEKRENTLIYRELIKIAFANPQVHFIYHRDGKEFMNLPPTEDIRERFAAIYRKKILGHLIEIDAHMEGIRLHGFITDDNFYRANRDGQFQYVNNRHVDIKNFSFLVKKSYGELLPHGSHPYYFLFLELESGRVDVNVHPAKKEVRMTDSALINSLVIRSVSDALRPGEPLSFSRYHRGAAGENGGGENEPLRFPAADAGKSSPALSPVDGILLSEHTPGQTQPMPSYPVRGEGERAVMAGSETASLHSYTDSLETRNGARAGEATEQETAFLPRRHFGVIFGTYILAEGDDGFYIIDQHTAHERINYERTRKNLEELQGKRQALLHPVTVDCTPDELDNVLEKKSELEAAGFLIEEFGRNAYLVRETPAYVEPGAETDAITHVIQRIMEGEDSYRIYDELAAMKACKASIKKNDHVAGGVLSEILVQLSQCENPSRCPHGRPTMVKLTQSELDRLFHRI